MVLVAASPGAVLIPFAFVAGAAPHLGCAAMSARMDDEENRWRNLGDQY